MWLEQIGQLGEYNVMGLELEGGRNQVGLGPEARGRSWISFKVQWEAKEGF